MFMSCSNVLLYLLHDKAKNKRGRGTKQIAAEKRATGTMTMDSVGDGASTSVLAQPSSHTLFAEVSVSYLRLTSSSLSSLLSLHA